MMAKRTLEDWLQLQEGGSPQIRLGLERVKIVAERLGLLEVPFRILTVAGTNGKGSTAALLEAVYRGSGYRTGLYLSPHLLHYAERISVQGIPVQDDQICEAFEAIAVGAEEIGLTYFEWGTLAAIFLFAQQSVDVAILEVGLGGRLDAVNVWDPDCAIITQVGLDHQAFLGPDRESIGFEKAGVFRINRPAVCGDRDPPRTVRQAPCAKLWVLGEDFDQEIVLPHGVPVWIHPDNAATALKAVALMEAILPVQAPAIRQSLQTVRLPGRQTRVKSPLGIEVVLDVAHNPQAVEYLSQQCAQPLKRAAVLGMFKDKDLSATIAPLLSKMHAWYLADLPSDRAASVDMLKECLLQAGVAPGVIHLFPNPEQAFQAAEGSGQFDEIVVWGSFLTVGPVWMGCGVQDQT